MRDNFEQYDFHERRRRRAEVDDLDEGINPHCLLGVGVFCIAFWLAVFAIVRHFYYLA